MLIQYQQALDYMEMFDYQDEMSGVSRKDEAACTVAEEQVRSIRAEIADRKQQGQWDVMPLPPTTGTKEIMLGSNQPVTVLQALAATWMIDFIKEPQIPVMDQPGTDPILAAIIDLNYPDNTKDERDLLQLFRTHTKEQLRAAVLRQVLAGNAKTPTPLIDGKKVKFKRTLLEDN